MQAGIDSYGATICGVSTTDCTTNKLNSTYVNQLGAVLCKMGGACPTAAAPAAAPAAPAAPPPPNPAVLAQQAVTLMKLRPVAIGIVPEDKPGKIGLVGMPTWMWAQNPGENVTGPITRTAAVGGVVVTAVGTLDRVVWNMGDGTSVTCHGAGTPYADVYGRTDSPTCGHRYQHPSDDQPGMAYTVSATSYWTVAWAGGGGAGVIPQEVASNTRIQVGELQVLTTGR